MVANKPNQNGVANYPGHGMGMIAAVLRGGEVPEAALRHTRLSTGRHFIDLHGRSGALLSKLQFARGL